MQALKRIRIQKAKMFLLYSQAPIEEIGKMCGYDSGSYFTKIFRELEGCSPSEYRRNIIF